MALIRSYMCNNWLSKPYMWWFALITVICTSKLKDIVQHSLSNYWFTEYTFDIFVLEYAISFKGVIITVSNRQANPLTRKLTALYHFVSCVSIIQYRWQYVYVNLYAHPFSQCLDMTFSLLFNWFPNSFLPIRGQRQNVCSELSSVMKKTDISFYLSVIYQIC